MTNHPVSISCSTASSSDSRDPVTVNFRVEDSLSGETLADLKFTADQWWKLCQGSYQTHMATVSSNLDRVGKKQKNSRISVPDEVTRHAYGKDAELAVQEWIDDGEHLKEPFLETTGKWEHCRVHNTNQGYKVTGWWYEEVTPEEELAYIDGYLI